MRLLVEDNWNLADSDFLLLEGLGGLILVNLNGDELDEWYIAVGVQRADIEGSFNGVARDSDVRISRDGITDNLSQIRLEEDGVFISLFLTVFFVYDCTMDDLPAWSTELVTGVEYTASSVGVKGFIKHWEIKDRDRLSSLYIGDGSEIIDSGEGLPSGGEDLIEPKLKGLSKAISMKIQKNNIISTQIYDKMK